MKLFGTLRNSGQPGEIQTPATGDLRTAIGQLFSEAQTSVNRGGNVDGTLWMESNNLKGAAHVPILSIKVNASKLPSLLLAMPAESGQLALGDGTEQQAPAIVACPYCDGVADLVDAGSLVWRYRCDKCAFESTYSPAQCAAWLAKSLIRSDRTRLENPKNDFDEKPDANVIALVSYCAAGDPVKLVGARMAYNGRYAIKLYGSNGKPIKGANVCREAKNIKDAYSLAKTVAAGKEAVEFHDPKCATATATNLWRPLPESWTKEEDLPKAFKWLEEEGTRCVVSYVVGEGTKKTDCYRPTVKGTKVGLDHNTSVDLSAVVAVYASLNVEEFGTAQKFRLFQREGWTPPAPAEKKAKKGKGKKAHTSEASDPATASVAIDGCPTDTVERIKLLNLWLDIYDLDDSPTGEQYDGLSNETESRVQLLEQGIVATENDDDIITRWQMVYPGINPLTIGDDAPADPGTLLRAWHNYVLDDSEADDDLLNDLDTGELTPEQRDALIARCQAAYPGVDPLAYTSPYRDGLDSSCGQ